MCDLKKISIKTRGYAKGVFEVRTEWNGEVFARIPTDFTNVWETYSADISVPNGKKALYFTFVGDGVASLLSFTLE